MTSAILRWRPRRLWLLLALAALWLPSCAARGGPESICRQLLPGFVARPEAIEVAGRTIDEPDGRTVVIVEELANDSAPIKVRDRLLKISVATGRVTVVNDLNILAGYQYEQVMYSNASGSVLVVSGARKGKTAGILRGDRYTPIPWDRHIATAIW